MCFRSLAAAGAMVATATLLVIVSMCFPVPAQAETQGPWGTSYPTNLRLSAASLTEDQWVMVA